MLFLYDRPFGSKITFTGGFVYTKGFLPPFRTIGRENYTCVDIIYPV